MGLKRQNGEEHRNYYLGLRVSQTWGYFLGGSNIKEYSIWEFIVAYFEKLHFAKEASSPTVYMSYSLNSLKGLASGLHGEYIAAVKGDTRSLGCS